MELETEDWGGLLVAPVSQGTWRVAAAGVATRFFIFRGNGCFGVEEISG